MPVPTLIIGLGGTGLKALLMIKERLIEAYGEMPQEVRLFDLDTDGYPADERRGTFNGIRLTLEGDKKWNLYTNQFESVSNDEVEFYHIRARDENMVIRDEILNRPEPEWSFIDAERINRTISSLEDRLISKGAKTIRPLSKLALYLDYENTINKIRQHTNWLNQISADPTIGNKSAKGRIFVLGSAAGGSGAGLVVDILKILGDLCSGSKALPTSCLLAGGQIFAREADLSRTFSNTYAVLRELERLGSMSKLYLPSKIPAKFYVPKKVIKNQFEPASEVIFFDYPDRLARERINLRDGGSYLDQVVVPTMADYVTVLIDKDVSAQMNSFKADFRQIFPLDVNHQREYKYLGVGIHSLIFPERDVRKTAGFKLLKEIWADCLVRDERLEHRDPGGSELEEPTKSIAEKHKKIVNQKLIPHVLAQIGFQSDVVVGDVVNNTFVKLAATSSLKGKIEIPTGFFDFLLNRSILERIFNLIGAPSKSGDVNEETKAQKSENFAKVFDDTIENYLSQRTTRKEVDEWRRIYWGPGPLGSEDMDKGEWMNIIRSDPYIQDHKSEFMFALGQVVKVILNDQGPEGIMPYRLEYAHRVLDELERLVKRWNQADEKENPSLLSEVEWFKKDLKKFQEKINKARKATNENDYKANVEAAARIRRNLVAYYLFEELCKLLLNAINNWQTELSEWRAHLRDALAIIQREESKHTGNRKLKEQIKVRTYITKDSFETELYQKHRSAALESFRGKVRWTYEIGEETNEVYDQIASKNNLLVKQVPVIWLEDSVFSKSVSDNSRGAKEYHKEIQDKLRLTAFKLATRAINWACTDKGNENRTDVQSAFLKLGSVEEVKMGDRVCDHYGASAGSSVGDFLTDEQVIATICPLKNWTKEKMIYTSYIPRHDITNNNPKTISFYQSLDIHLQNKMEYRRNYSLNSTSENPRLAYGMEMTLLWQLKDLMGYEKYANSYSNDDRKRQALHCLPEEKLASQVYEVAINYRPKEDGLSRNDLFGELGILLPIRLVPEIVDLLSSRERLELFAQAFACHMINNKYNTGEEFNDLIDLYLYPDPEKSNRYRLSKMQDIQETDSVLSDLVPDTNRLVTIRVNSNAGRVILNRARFWYALRTFMLGEKDLDDTNRSLPYKKLKNDVEQYLAGKNPDAVYDDAVEIFKKWYLEYKDAGDNLIVLAHLGLLMMAVYKDLGASRTSYLKDDSQGDDWPSNEIIRENKGSSQSLKTARPDDSEELLSNDKAKLRSLFTAIGNAKASRLVKLNIKSTPKLIEQNHDSGDVIFLITAPDFFIEDGQNKIVVPINLKGISVDLELRARFPGSYQIKIEPFIENTPHVPIVLDVVVSNTPEKEFPKLPNPLKPRAVPQPDVCIRAYTSLVDDIGGKIKIEYILYSPIYSLHFPGSTPSGSVTIKTFDLRRILARLEKVVSIESVDGKSQNLSSVGKDLYDLLFPDVLKKYYMDISKSKVRNILILSDPSLWIPWELLKPYGTNWEHEHLGQRYNLGRWIEGWGAIRQDEFPIGQVCLVGVSEYSKHYSLSEWKDLLGEGDISRLDKNLFVEWSGGIPAAMQYQTPIWGLHFEDIPDALVEKSGEMVRLDDKSLSPENVRTYALNLHTKRPLVTFGMRSHKNISAFTHMEEKWLPVFIQSGASAFVGTLWAVQPDMDQLFWRVFYQAIWKGLALGEAINIARQNASDAYPESIDGLSYYLIGDPMSIGYVPPLGDAFVTLECLEHDVNQPLVMGKKYKFQTAIRNSPPIWYRDRLHQSTDTKWSDPMLQVIANSCTVAPSELMAFTELSPSHLVCKFELTPKELKHIGPSGTEEEIFFNYLLGSDREILKSIAIPVTIRSLEAENE